MTKARSNATAPAAKGELVVGTGSDVSGILGVGSNNTVLTADSTTATGLKWATAGGGFQPQIGYVLANRLLRPQLSDNYSSQDLNNNTTYYMPIFLPNCTIDRIQIISGSSVANTANFRLGIYNMNNTTNLPSTVLLGAGTVSVTASVTGTIFSITVSQAITAGWYFLAVNKQASVSCGVWTAFSKPTMPSFITNMNGSAYNEERPMSLIQSSVSGAFATAGTVTIQNNAPFVTVRIQP